MTQRSRTPNLTAIKCESSNFLLYQCLENLLDSVACEPPWHWIRRLVHALQIALRTGEHPYHLSQRIQRKRCPKILPLSALTREQATCDLQAIQQLRQTIRQRNSVPGSRKLDRYQQEIQTLCQMGASLRDIQHWLLGKRNLRVSVSTVQRYIRRGIHAKTQRTC